MATPIGNLGDITLRALAVLAGVEAVICEDSRVTGRLLAHYGITARLIAYHEHNAPRLRPRLIARLAGGAALALVADAGTPLLSDPGFKLVRAALARGIPVTALPGPSAVLAALVLSGLPTDRFFFACFLPPRPAARRRALGAIAPVPGSLVFFESPRRLPAALADMAAVLGPRPSAVARELTKRFEEVRRDRLDALAAHYRAAGPPRGEVTVVVGPPGPAAGGGAADEAALEAALRAALASGSRRDAVARVARALGLPRRQVYARALSLDRGRGKGR